MKRWLLILVLPAIALAAWGQAPGSGTTKSSKTEQVSPFADYVGDWVATLDGKVWLLLTLELHDGELKGWLTHSRDLEINDEGGLRLASGEKVKEAIASATVHADGLLLTVKYGDKTPDQYLMRVIEPGKAAELKMVVVDLPAGMPEPKPWSLIKFPGGVEVEPH